MLRRILPFLALAAAVLAAVPPPAAFADDVDGGLRQAPRATPRGRPQGLVFLFSGAQGLDPAFLRAARRITGFGVEVVMVDTPAYLRRIDRTPGEDCLFLIPEIEVLSRDIEAGFGNRRFLSPILAGTGPGGTLALQALAQAPAATIAGAAIDGPDPALRTIRPLCPGAEAKPAAGGGFAYAPFKDWPGFVRAAPTPGQEEELRAYAEASALPAGAVVPPPPGADLAERMALLLEGPIRDQQGSGSPLGDLPVVEMPVAADRPGRLMAVILSGDGGWRDIDKQVAGVLQADGVPVVGLDALRYFWTPRTPDQLAADVARIMAHYQAAWHRPEVLLVGYSFGADVLPFAVNRLPPAARAAVRQVSLLGLSPWADFEIHVSGWVGDGPNGDSKATAPELARMDRALVQCVYGADEADSACRDPAMAAAERIETAGGHHFDGDYAALARRILEGASRRGG